jgi:hypothetical protein
VNTVLVRRNGKKHVTFVSSDSEYQKEYELATLPDGTLACACMGWAFSKDRPKTCHHTRAYIAAQGASVYRATKPASKPKEPAKTETFTFRRAISFDDIPV